ncbi:hypothetical protein [Hephaestia mangrovi]|uniref:hypothetical protein n=1 Tax=Hephaestia mangrovi TaxID=2873268 RepID=UPI001CA6CA57|nr:hypothetical protein [Hephaestia mangrovi]MBY8829429.1 hypothetical protein [Hephaestia mangrovi]
MKPRVDIIAHPSWRSLSASAEQLWLAPLIVGAAWWNAVLETWLDLSRDIPRRHDDTHDHPQAHNPLEPAPDIALFA